MPLVLLGGLRVLAVKALNYQEHVSEYGVHWNFFFTLAAVSVLSSAVLTAGARCGLRPSHCAPLALALVAAQQAALSLTGLSAFILDAPRRTFLEQNREGLASVPGYLALHFIGVHIGAHVHRALHERLVSQQRQRSACASTIELRTETSQLPSSSSLCHLLSTVRAGAMVALGTSDGRLRLRIRQPRRQRAFAVPRASHPRPRLHCSAVCRASWRSSLCCTPRVRCSCSPCRAGWSAAHRTPARGGGSGGAAAALTRQSPLPALCSAQVNAAYVCWQAWLNALLLLCFWALELLWADGASPPPPPLLRNVVTRALAQHSLLFFLVSNAATGVVNLLMDTLHASSAAAVTVLLLYAHAAIMLTLLYAKLSPTRSLVPREAHVSHKAD